MPAPSTCATCGKPAACIGQYDTSDVEPACDSCCGHGCEDGWCVAIESERGAQLLAERERDDTCPDCGGDGYVEVDAADHRGEHYTRTVKCRCREGVDGFDDGDAREPEPDLDAEVAW